MKPIYLAPLCAALALFASCQKQETDEEKAAEIERQVQQRVAAERQADEAQKLAQREAELNAREQALANQQPDTSASAPVARSTSTPVASDTGDSDSSASYDTFYRKLEPYGAWRETTDYGYVWQPQEAEQSRAWKPYTNGRWVYTDAGWTWVSEEPYGWATYHYGRWTRLRNIGWVWVPGEEWAPAWVSWRKSDQFVGWAPLPPEAQFERRTGIHNWADSYYDIGPEQYAFVPVSDFGAERVEQSVVPAERNVTIVNQTTNVTNITYNNTIIINQGPNYEELRSRSRRPIERLRIERRTTFGGNEDRRPVVRGEVIEIAAPAILHHRGGDRPRSIRETVAQTVVDRGWGALADQQAAEQTRAKIQAEATPPPNGPSRKFPKPATTVATPAAASPAPTAAGTATTAATRPAERTSPAPAVSPRATAAAPPSATVSSPTASPKPSSTPSASPSPRGSVTASPSPTSSAVASPKPATTPVVTPSATAPKAITTPAPTAAPVSTPKPSPTHSVAASTPTAAPTKPSATPLPTAGLKLVPLPTAAPSAAPSAAATSTATPAAVSGGAGGITPQPKDVRQGRRNPPGRPDESGAAPVVGAQTPPAASAAPSAAASVPPAPATRSTPVPALTPQTAAPVPSVDAAAAAAKAQPPARGPGRPPAAGAGITAAPAAASPASAGSLDDAKPGDKKHKRDRSQPGAVDPSASPSPSPATAP